MREEGEERRGGRMTKMCSEMQAQKKRKPRIATEGNANPTERKEGSCVEK